MEVYLCIVFSCRDPESYFAFFFFCSKEETGDKIHKKYFLMFHVNMAVIVVMDFFSGSIR